jgi:phage shock protein C
MHSFSPPPRNRIYRSRKNRVFFGVCGGLADHFDFNAWAVRLVAILLTFVTLGVFAPIIYIIAGLMMREAPEQRFTNTEDEDFWNLYQNSRTAALHKVQRRFEQLSRRIERIESIVTSPKYGLEDEWKKL